MFMIRDFIGIVMSPKVNIRRKCIFYVALIVSSLEKSRACDRKRFPSDFIATDKSHD